MQGGVINGSMLGLELMGKGYGGNGGVIINMASGAGVFPISKFLDKSCQGGIKFWRQNTVYTV